MAEIVPSEKPLAVNPLKVSQPVGASLAFLGLAQAMPLEHGARGCTSFNKLFFMRHFQEPIALQTTAMDQIAAVIGADGNVVEALRTIADTNAPEVIGLITTALSETQGADIPRTVRAFRERHPEHDHISIVAVSASDTLGCLETGFAASVEAIIAALVPASLSTIRRPRQVNVLAASSRSASAAMAMRAPPIWKWQSTMASISWARCRSRRAGTGRRAMSLRVWVKASQASTPVRLAKRWSGTPVRSCNRSAARASDGPITSVAIDSPMAVIAARRVPP